LRLFADNLSELIDDHPALIEAFAQGQMRTAIAASVANQMLERLLAGGLPLRGAGTAYAAMHALVLGHAVLREAGKSVVSPGSTLTQVADGDDDSALATYTAREGRLVDITLHEMLDVLIAGIEHNLDTGRDGWAARGSNPEPAD